MYLSCLTFSGKDPIEDWCRPPPDGLDKESCYVFSKNDIKTHQRKNRGMMEYECVVDLLTKKLKGEFDAILFDALLAPSGRVTVMYKPADLNKIISVMPRTRYSNAPLYKVGTDIYVWKPSYVALLPPKNPFAGAML